ncbi:MD-2-related lipid recognition domain-containing protein / ML domain-containing protein [Rhynchospora pubera]|uniref:MD-2-related lipid recognition domain-containing protein / ML domain-containing protein n=1 Tax=Rhynchospora pubera TaxID=906938 RepID=A0AAV8BUI3_9POAL|nr:MD-2-related lipid recognition domain-containing protein / ML domain-containing protein [Rhynchospora pubera]
MAKLVILSLLVLASSLVASAVHVDYCNKKANYAVSVSSVDIIPNPVIPGKLATFNISASTDKSITGGKMIIDVNYFFIHVDQETHDLCEGTSCPATGNFAMVHQRELPSYTPPGSYTITMKMQDSEGKLLTCIRFGFSIGLVSDS